MTSEQWAEIGEALRKANDDKWPEKNQQPFVDMSDLLGDTWTSSKSQPGSDEPYEFSWVTRKLFGWLLKDAA